jgi:hypothetical protein
MKTVKALMIAVATVVLIGVAPLAGSPALRTPGQPADDGKREFTVSGCLLRSGYAAYQIEDARLDAIDGKPVGEPPASASAGSATGPKKWALEGGGNLGPRVGEKVQVVGRSDWQPAASAAPPDEPPNRVPRLEVKSVKTVAASCS